MLVGNDRWQLDPDLIRRGGADIASPFDGRGAEVRWVVNRVPCGALPASVVECRMSALGHVVNGLGDALFFRDSLTQCFAEAWERLWLQEWTRRRATDGASSSSNGWASGATAEDAAQSARSELIERAVFLRAWDLRAGWMEVPVRGLLNQVRAASLERLGWRVSLFRLTEVRLGEVYCGLGTRDQGGIVFDACHRRPSLSEAAAQAKVLRSLLRSGVLFDSMPAGDDGLADRGGPQSHKDYYRNPSRAAAFDFLSAWPQPDTTISLSKYDGIETQNVVSLSGYPFVARATNPCWPELRWGRESLVEGGNPWPHPLA